MKTNTRYILPMLLIASVVLFFQCSREPREVKTQQKEIPLDKLNMAMNQPSKFAWLLFAEHFAPNDKDPKGTKWDSWIEQNEVYGNPCGVGPVWPSGIVAKKLHKSVQFGIINRQSGSSDGLEVITGVPFWQEVRINRPFFDYVLKNDLWYLEGIYQKASNEGIDLPLESTVIKSDWKIIPAADTSRYYSKLHVFPDSLDNQPVYIGLAAFHLVSKELPHWFWSTFEHKDNIGRCDNIGCKDDFGNTLPWIPPHKIDSLEYAPGKVTAALNEVFERYEINPVFKNYRLRGTQTEFTNSKGENIYLGSSVLEAGFVESSSCKTCHALSTLDSNYSSLNFLVSDSVNWSREPGRKPIPKPVFVAGNPDSAWFSHGNDSTPGPPMYQLDFMWQFTLAGFRDTCSAQ